MAYLAESGVQVTQIDAGNESLGAVLRGISKQLARQYLEGRESVEIVADIRAEDVG